MEDMKQYVEGLIRQTREDLEFQKKTDPEDPWIKFLEGKIQALRLVQEYIDKRYMKDQLH